MLFSALQHAKKLKPFIGIHSGYSGWRMLPQAWPREFVIVIVYLIAVWANFAFILVKQNWEIGLSPFHLGILDKTIKGLKFGSWVPIYGHREKMSSNKLMILLLINFNTGIKLQYSLHIGQSVPFIHCHVIAIHGSINDRYSQYESAYAIC